MNLFLVCFISGASFLLSFLLFFHPLRANVIANKWLSLSVFIIGCAFAGTYLVFTGATISHNLLFKFLSSLQFLLAPSLYTSILYFVNPTKIFRKIDWLHFLPFIIYVVAESVWNQGKDSISTFTLFELNKEVSILVMNILPLIALLYLIKCYLILQKHKVNLKLISSSLNQISLVWLVQFLFILLIVIIIWINDALFGLPFLTGATNFVYAVSIFFLGYYSIKQKAIFAFKERDMKKISEVLEYEHDIAEDITSQTFAETATTAEPKKDAREAVEVIKEKAKLKRLNAEQVTNLSSQLSKLMEQDQLFLDNDLNLPMVAEKLGIGIHEASYLINETTNDNFYNFINRYRVEESKKLLASAKVEELNILGIAFASGFNSKTTFNTTFKKMVGVSPSQFSKEQKNSPK